MHAQSRISTTVEAKQRGYQTHPALNPRSRSTEGQALQHTCVPIEVEVRSNVGKERVPRSINESNSETHWQKLDPRV